MVDHTLLISLASSRPCCNGTSLDLPVSLRESVVHVGSASQYPVSETSPAPCGRDVDPWVLERAYDGPVSPLERYLQDMQRYEQIALSIPSSTCHGTTAAGFQFQRSMAPSPIPFPHSICPEDVGEMAVSTEDDEDDEDDEDNEDHESEGTNPIRRYLSDSQDHERIAMQFYIDQAANPAVSPSPRPASPPSSLSLSTVSSIALEGESVSGTKRPLEADDSNDDDGMDIEAVLEAVKFSLAEHKRQRALEPMGARMVRLPRMKKRKVTSQNEEPR
ncbi:hypothetical protein GQ53DRAFT_811369 [Thozetella sp. PMI_491]|nr:hypothetical protein GQ53DRAFT_811369 [Thozetella sp. PMI_491]